MIAQHRELHTIFGSILSKHKTGYRGHPAVKLYLGEHLPCALSYHEYTVEEMERRGWTGHQTPLSDELRSVAATRSGPDTCRDWHFHVDKIVTSEEMHRDMHDLVERWTNENKMLRNDLATMCVEEHGLWCSDACCVTYAKSLVAEFHDRVGRSMLGEKIPLKGHTSLHGRLELLVT